MGEAIDGSPSEFQVHEQANAQLSAPLHTLTTGELSEAQDARTAWKEVSKDTFERFVQFAYSGDYSIPDTMEWDEAAELQEGGADTLRHTPLGSPAALENDVETDMARGWETSEVVSPRKKKGKASVGIHPKRTAEVEVDFPSMRFSLAAPRHPSCKLSEDFHTNRSYSRVFLSHASLFVLGDYWMVGGLKALAINKLHRTLCVF